MLCGQVYNLRLSTCQLQLLKEWTTPTSTGDTDELT